MSNFSKDNILIITAISYTNGEPHVSHLYESVLADFITKSFGLFTNIKLLELMNIIKNRNNIKV